MCGIAGFVGEGNRKVVYAMGNSLLHRGPDAGNARIIDNVGLAHRRLSIIDLSDSGTQPMTTQDGRYTIVYNGEVFNYRDLKERYLSNEKFISETDTEVILQLFAKLGISAFDKLEGMYAFALYDNKEKTLCLHRDRLGKKPLFYSNLEDGSCIFGSELKALNQHPAFKSEIDPEAVYQYLLYEYIPTPRTIYKDVFKLTPGEILIISDNKQTSQMVAPIALKEKVIEDPVKILEQQLSEAVSRRLVADVPVGIFLSGGLDSSLVASFAQQQASLPIKTFSIGFEDESFNEQAAAQKVADHLGTEHYKATLGLSDIKRLLPKLPDVLDEPMGDSSIIPTLLVSEHARQQVTVCLTGDGADELFLGYGTFYAHRWAERFEHVPLQLRRALYSLACHLPVSHSYMSFDFKLKRFLQGCLVEPRYRNTYWLSSLDPEMISVMATKHVDRSSLIHTIDSWHENETSNFAGIKEEYLRGYLQDDILVKADRASMAYGLEVRSPFLDENIVAFASNLDDRYKLRGRKGKHILRQIASPRLPSEIIWRKKQGFNFPVGSMIRNELKDEFSASILDGGLNQLDLFKRDKLESLLSDHIGGRADHRKALWSLYVLSNWADKWCKT